MKVARYVGSGQIAIVDEPIPACPPGGLLVRTEASGLCSGELMDWYMDQKIPHVLGHEVCGRVVETQDERFPVGARVFPHHHAPCMECELCRAGNYVHCAQWKRTKLIPGGMAELFGVSAENLTDTLIVDEKVRPRDAALVEPLACVVKSIRRGAVFNPGSVAIIGLGVMGLLHNLVIREAVGYELNEGRREWAKSLGLDARAPGDSDLFDLVFVCPGTSDAIQFAIDHTAPGGVVLLFSPLGPPGRFDLPLDSVYFRDISLITSYSCGPNDTREALRILTEGRIPAEHVVSHFIGIDQLPEAYAEMKRGEILKPMVEFPRS